MRTAPGVARAEFAAAIRESQDAVGSDWVYTAEADIDLYRDAYSPFPGEAGEISVHRPRTCGRQTLTDLEPGRP